jgi:Yersinia/Haemophilus virulence surface antigen
LQHILASDVSGNDLIDAVLATARTKTPEYSIFFLNMRKGGKGHTIGIHLQNDLHFFDSNFGEFAFPNGSEQDQQSFFNTWWRAYRNSQFELWALDGVKQKPQMLQ